MHSSMWHTIFFDILIYSMQNSSNYCKNLFQLNQKIQNAQLSERILFFIVRHTIVRYRLGNTTSISEI